MGIFNSCLSKNNKVGVLGQEEPVYQSTRPHLVTTDMLEARGGMAFSLTFNGASGKPKLPPIRLENRKREDNFEKWRGI
jgi:hypothetical protein